MTDGDDPDEEDQPPRASTLARVAWAIVLVPVFLLFVLPLLAALLLSLFFGPAAFSLVMIAWGHAIQSPLQVPRAIGGKVDYTKTIERSGPFSCYNLAVVLASNAQPQPFAVAPGDLDWQPQISGPLDAQPTGRTHWLETPLTEAKGDDLPYEMRYCGLSDDVRKRAADAIAQPGSWVAFKTRGRDDVYIYSKPQSLAVIFSNEND